MLLLGMVYSKKPLKANRGQGYRDAARCQALADMGYTVRSMDDKHADDSASCSSAEVLHCNGNFTIARRLNHALQSSFQATDFDAIILDYFMSPGGWARDRWTKSFYDETLPKFAEDNILKPGGSIWLPNLQCVEVGAVPVLSLSHLLQLSYLCA